VRERQPARVSICGERLERERESVFWEVGLAAGNKWAYCSCIGYCAGLKNANFP